MPGLVLASMPAPFQNGQALENQGVDIDKDQIDDCTAFFSAKRDCPIEFLSVLPI